MFHSRSLNHITELLGISVWYVIDMKIEITQNDYILAS